MGKSKKAKFGQFNTGKNECEFTINQIKKYFELKGTVLEPSFGSGNFVSELRKNNLQIDCYEVDKNIFKPLENTNSYLGDFLMTNFDKKYDFIIGNPPYIELVYSFYSEEEKNKLKSLFSVEKRGRVNLVHFFMDKSFDLVKNEGVIAYLLPSTILSSPWYNDVRKKIYEEYTVVDIICEIPFKEVSIDICLLILQKKVDNQHKNILLKNDFYVLTKNKSKGKTLKERGFDCQTGNILWYKNKDILTDLPTNRILIYSNNIKDGEIILSDKLKSKIEGKKQYISSEIRVSVKNCIVMPRVVSKNMRFSLIKDNQCYLFENHVMIITHHDGKMLEELYEKLQNKSLSFQNYFNSSNITVNEILNFEY